MAPIHESDIAEQRWTQAEWEHYELWEQIEHRLRRRKRLWITATVVLFMVISALPIVHEQWPRWSALAASRRLAQEINGLKRAANLEKAAFSLQFTSESGYVIEKRATCAGMGTAVRSGDLNVLGSSTRLAVIGPAHAEELGLGRVVSSFCYDPWVGSQWALAGRKVVGFAIAPANDLTERAPEQRLERLSTLLLSGPSAEISFE